MELITSDRRHFVVAVCKDYNKYLTNYMEQSPSETDNGSTSVNRLSCSQKPATDSYPEHPQTI
jgi:hypothetical protein